MIFKSKSNWEEILYESRWITSKIDKMVQKYHQSELMNRVLYFKGKKFRYKIYLDSFCNPDKVFRKRRS